ncbi:hypothetical protein [Sphingobium yanoikuyae]|uniref:hypothetical protein n=1 Tax=Sphingobium yanoikuyae TaxID=13690 RepID=UPI000F086E35
MFDAVGAFRPTEHFHRQCMVACNLDREGALQFILRTDRLHQGKRSIHAEGFTSMLLVSGANRGFKRLEVSQHEIGRRGAKCVQHLLPIAGRIRMG